MDGPPHPGKIIREECLNPLLLTTVEAAAALGIARPYLSKILNGHAGITADTAVRLCKVFGGQPENWLQRQADYDLWKARSDDARLQVQPISLVHPHSQVITEKRQAWHAADRRGIDLPLRPRWHVMKHGRRCLSCGLTYPLS